MPFNRIILKASAGDRYEEARAGGTITPGQIIMLTSTGTVIVHGTADGAGESAFAIEDSLQGRTISTNYTTGELVRYWIALPGDEVYGIVPAAAPAIVVGAALVSNGAGYLKLPGATPLKIFGTALEAVDNSGGGSPARIRIRVR